MTAPANGIRINIAQYEELHEQVALGEPGTRWGWLVVSLVVSSLVSFADGALVVVWETYAEEGLWPAPGSAWR